MTPSKQEYREKVIREYEAERARRGVEFGECFCGCKGKTTIAIASRHDSNFLQDFPHRFLTGHKDKKPRKIHPKKICPTCGGRKNVAGAVCRSCFRIPKRIDPQIYIIAGKPCRKLHLTREKVAIVDAVDYEKVSDRTWCARWHPRTRSYIAISWGFSKKTGKQSNVIMSRIITGAPEGIEIDHDNHDTLDNRQSNLRPSTDKTNSYNRRVHIDNTTGYKGVSERTCKDGSKCYPTQIQIDGKKISLGTHGTPQEAAKAYDRAAIKYFKDFAWLNFPRSDYEDQIITCGVNTVDSI